jgi:hypothetical protein
VAAHAQDGDAQSILRLHRRLGRHIDARLGRDAVPPAIDQFLPDSFLLIIMSLYFMRVCYIKMAIVPFSATGDSCNEATSAFPVRLR